MAKTCPVCGTTYADTSVFCPADGTSLRADTAAGDLVGSVISDRYLVNRLLGEGGMGRVYLAQHVRLPQQAAIKVLHPGMVEDQDAVARFNREAANAARIEHERVARVFDFGETKEGLVYLAMEYVPGRTLRSLVDEGGRLPPARAANLVFQVAEGLDAAHRISIVHRDLKPDNILVVTDEQGVDRCKVVDFGIAKATGAANTTTLTRTGMVVGTPEFMSPEQVVGETVGAQSDVYALALVAYQLFTGVLPFSANTPERALTARLIEDPRTLAAVVADVAWPADLQQAFDRALDREPATRTASALAFAEAVVASVEVWTGTAVLRRTPLNIPTTSATGSMTTGGAAARAASVGSAPTQPRSAVPHVPTSATAKETATPVATPAGSGGRRLPVLLGAGALATVLAIAAIILIQGDGATDTTLADSGMAPAESTMASVDGRATGAVGNRGDIARPGGGTQGAGAAPQTSAPAGDTARGSALTPGAGSVTPAGLVVSEAEGIAARQQLDSVRAMLEDPNSGEREAREAIPKLQRVLQRLPTSSDSTWAYLAIANAHAQSGEPLRSCAPLRSARRLASTDAQRRAVSNYSDALACAPL